MRKRGDVMDDKARQNMAGQSSATLGARLMARRKELGWRLEDVEAYLKVRLATLQAIEGGRYAELPDKVYALGFIKSYARLLGMESEEFMQQARQELSSLAPPRQSVHLVLPGPQEGRSAGLWVLLAVGLVVIAGGYAGWYHFSSHGQLASSVLPSHLAETGETPAAAVPPVATQPTVPSPAAGQSATAQPTAPVLSSGAQGAATGAGDTPKDTPDLPPAPEAVSPSATAMPSTVDAAGNEVLHNEGDHPAGSSSGDSVTGNAPSAMETSKAQSPQPTPAQQAPAPSQEAADRVAILAREDSWVQVTDASGKVLLVRVLKKGESWQGTAGETYRVTSGNAGGVVFQAGNVVSAPLGLRGRVVRNVTVDAASVEQGHYGYGSLATGAGEVPGPADKRSQ